MAPYEGFAPGTVVKVVDTSSPLAAKPGVVSVKHFMHDDNYNVASSIVVCWLDGTTASFHRRQLQIDYENATEEDRTRWSHD